MIKNLHLAPKNVRDELMSDIDILQLASDENIFKKSMILFCKKHSKSKDFIKYLNTQWFTTHSNWYEGVKYQIPSTNNALESFNLRLKNEETLRERMPLPRFLNQCLVSTNKWSIQYDVSSIIISQEQPTIDLSDWTDAYHLAKSNKIYSSKKFKNWTEFYFPAKESSQKCTEEEIKHVKNKQYSSFDLFKERAFCVWIIKFFENDWLYSTCTCPNFLKKYKCKHLIALAIRLKLVSPPDAVKQVPIGQKRKRGRPKKSTMALIMA